jgi:hypothetical protein
MNLAAVLVCIVIVFLMCHMPRLLLNLINEIVTGRRIFIVVVFLTCHMPRLLLKLIDKLLQEEGYEP